MARLLFVCSGNTCRSPLAAAWARRIVADHAAAVAVASAGISAVDGEPATMHARVVAAQAGLELSDHQSTRLEPALIEAADLVLTMTAAHRDAIVRQWPRHAGRVMTLGEAAGIDADVADPFGGPVEDYERVSAQLAKLIKAAWPTIAGGLGV